MGGGWGAPLFVQPKSYFLGDLKPHAKFGKPTITPSGRKVTQRREEKITPLIVDTLFPCQRTQPLGPIKSANNLIYMLYSFMDLTS